MTDEEKVKLNRLRLNTQLTKMLSYVKPNQKQLLNNSHISHDGKPIKLNEINFNKSSLFIMSKDLLGVLGLYGLQRINNVRPDDKTNNARYSTKRTSYMIATSQEALLSRTPMDYTEGVESYEPINYVNKDVVLWRLFIDSGIGDSTKMYRIVDSISLERYLGNKINWYFFIGNKDEVLSNYNLPDIEVYEIMTNDKSTNKGGLF